MTARAKLEVHEHSCIRSTRKIVHSHEGGDVRHRHDRFGPATYTIDKDAWLAATGLRGGGRKKYTAQPTGEQLPIIEVTDLESSFDITVVGEPCAEQTGPGLALPNRMILGHKMRVGRVVVGRGKAVRP